jgi:hypothetical protein
MKSISGDTVKFRTPGTPKLTEAIKSRLVSSNTKKLGQGRAQGGVVGGQRNFFSCPMFGRIQAHDNDLATVLIA